MAKLPSVPKPLQHLVEAEIHRCHLVAKCHYQLADIPWPEILYDIKGTTAGLWYSQGSKLRLNPILFLENQSSFISDTVTHEIGHQLARLVHGRGIRPHGNEWKAVMRVLGGSTDRCHTMDISSVRKQHAYHCACPGRTYQLTERQHQKQSRSQGFICKVCRNKLLSGSAASSNPKPAPIRPPSPAQLKFVQDLARKAGKTLPADVLASAEKVGKAITKFLAKPTQASTPAPPGAQSKPVTTVTLPQQTLIKKLIQDRNLNRADIPRDVFFKKEAARVWISDMLKSKK